MKKILYIIKKILTSMFECSEVKTPEQLEEWTDRQW